MTRRTFLTVAPAAAASAPAQRGRKPNILIILMDDLGCRDLGVYGAADLKTPNIDRIARAGAVFENWYSNAPVCAPARAALMTGRYPIRAGMPSNGLDLPAREKLIPELLKPAGYATACIGKWHLGMTPETAPNARGFDYFYGFHSGCVDYYSHRYYWGEPRRVNYHDLWRNREEIFEDGQYLTERIAQETCQFIEAHRAQPFFVYTAFNAVHYPMHAPRKYVERFPNLDPERRMYAAMLAAADDGVGEILRTLDRIGQRENTLIFVLGDNGATTEARAGLNQKPASAGRNGVFRGYKFSLFDGGMHVPGIMSWPAVIPKEQIIRELVMTVDVLPTVCHVAGVPVPADRTIDGRNVLAVAASRAASPHGEIFWANGKQLAVRRGKWKLVINGIPYDGTEEGRKPLTGEDALFLSDLETDPGERTNLRRKHPELVDELSTAAHKWREEVERN
jgi:arylsulfatase A-like enzyme